VTADITTDVSLRPESGDFSALSAPNLASDQINAMAPSAGVIKPYAQLALPPIAAAHLHDFPYRAPENVKECRFWYEGTFDPIGPHHVQILVDTMNLGFTHATLGIVFQNPYKPSSSAFEHRYQMACRAIRAAGLNVAQSPEEPGIYIPVQEDKFHVERLKAIYGHNSYILIGPDNFEKAYTHNVLWVHPPEIRENPTALRHFGFRSMMDETVGFRRRVLVYPALHDIHATDIREGRQAAPPPVQEYFSKHGLYKGETTPQAPAALTIPEKPLARILSLKEVIARRDIAQAISLGLGTHGLLTETVSDGVHQTLASFDDSELTEVNKVLKVGPGKSDPNDVKYVPFVPTLQRLRETVFDAAIGLKFVSEGAEHVGAALEQGKRIVFMGNHGGWGDMVLLDMALRHNSIGALADKTVYVFNEAVYPDDFIASLVGGGFSRVALPAAERLSTGFVGADTGAQQTPPLKAVVSAASKQIVRGKAISIFPEGEVRPDYADTGLSVFSPFAISLVARENLAEKRLRADDIVIIPWAQTGGASLVRAAEALISEDSPPCVRFGKPISASTLNLIRDWSNSEPVAAHVIGVMVAEMLPAELAGVYGPYNERYLTDPSALHRLSITQLGEIELARKILGQVRQPGFNGDLVLDS